MKQGAFAGAIAGIIGIFSAATPAEAQLHESITVHNSTGYTIAQIFISPASERSWQEDILDLDVLVDGDEAEIDFRRAERTCDWDLMVVYDDGEAAIWSGLDLCEDWRYELFYNAQTGNTHLVSSH